MNLTQFRTAVLTRMGLPSGDALFDSTALNALVNAALRQIETEGDWSWLEDTEDLSATNGDGDYALATDYVRTIAVQIGNDAPLKRLPLKELLYMGGATGQPLYYGFRGDQMLLRPVPGTSYTVVHTHIRHEAELSGDTDEPYLPEPYHQAVVEYAAYLGFRRSNNLEDAGAALSAYQEWVKRMLARGGRDSESEGGGMMPAEQVAAEAARSATKG